MTAGHTDAGEPITGRDVIALLATIGIDMGLLAMAIINPPRETAARSAVRRADTGKSAKRSIRLSTGRRATTSSGYAATSCTTTTRPISSFRTSTVAIPDNKDEAAKAMAINQLAGVLSDLDLVRWPKGGKWWTFRENELKGLKKEESSGSDTDLTAIRKKWAEEQGLSGEELQKYVDKRAVRNHGLFSKAERALQIAGWSEKARSDVEIFKLVNSEGLTPLLMVLNEPGGASRSELPRRQSSRRLVSAGCPQAF